MPDKRMRDLPTIDALADDDVVIVSDASETTARRRPKKAPISLFKALFNSSASALTAALNQLQLDVRAEETNRITGDQNERQARRDADAALDTKISDETTNRSHADTALSDRITTNHNNISQGLSQAGANLANEVTRRENGDAALDTRVSALEQGGGGSGSGTGSTPVSGGGLTAAQANKLEEQWDNPLSTPAVRTGDWKAIGAYQWFPYDETHYNNINMSRGDVMVAPAVDGKRYVLIGMSALDTAETGDMLAVLMELTRAESYISIKSVTGDVLVSGNLVVGETSIIRGPYTVRIQITPDAFNESGVVDLNISAQSAIEKGIENAFAQISDLAHGATLTNQRIDNLPPFFGIQHVPAGLAGSDFPDFIDIVFSEKITRKRISGVTFVIGGNPLALDSDTPISLIDENTELHGLLRFELAGATKVNLKISAERANTKSLPAELTITYTDGTNHAHNFAYPVNNPAFAFPRIPAEFETPVGNSPAILPVGTKYLALMFREGTDYWPGTVRLSQLSVQSRRVYFDTHQPAGIVVARSVAINMAYVPNSRQLTYSVPGGSDIDDALEIIAIGYA